MAAASLELPRLDTRGDDSDSSSDSDSTSSSGSESRSSGSGGRNQPKPQQQEQGKVGGGEGRSTSSDNDSRKDDFDHVDENGAATASPEVSRVQETQQSTNAPARGSALHLYAEVEHERGGGFWGPRLHRLYQWMCLPYEDEWLPYPSKETLSKTNYYIPFWSRFPGTAITLGMLTLIVLYSLFSLKTLWVDNRLEQNAPKLLYRDDVDATVQVPGSIGIGYVDADGIPVSAVSALLNVTAFACSAGGTCGEQFPVLSCTVARFPALCPNGSLVLAGNASSSDFAYVRVSVALADGASASDLQGGSFVFYSQYRLEDSPERVRRTLDINLAFNKSVAVPYASSEFPHSTVFFHKTVYRFHSRYLSKIDRWATARFLRLDTAYEATALSAGELARFSLELDPTFTESKLKARNILDVGANVGGIYMLCLVVLALFSEKVIKTAFWTQNTGQFKVDPDVAKLLLTKKAEELQYYKLRLTEMQANEVMRMSLNEMFTYLNQKRDAELSTFKDAMFESLNFKQRKAGGIYVDDDVPESMAQQNRAQQRIGAMTEKYQRARLDELQELIRIDRVDQIVSDDDVNIPKFLNMLIIRTLRKNVALASDFFAHCQKELEALGFVASSTDKQD